VGSTRLGHSDETVAWTRTSVGPAHPRYSLRADLLALRGRTQTPWRTASGISEQDAADTIYALASEVTVFLRLTSECGWDDMRYADLLARALTRT
jgi:hypothetical protein